MLSVENLHFSYTTGQDILKGITLQFDRRPTAIIGQNGAGKTTFAKLLKGLLKPLHGDVYVKGVNTKETTAAQLARQIGLVFQNPHDQIFKSKVIDEVMFGPLNLKQEKETARANAIEALHMVGMENKLDKNPYDLGLSEQKLICIASVLAMQPEIVIFDEPTIAQDYPARERIKEIIQHLRQKGKLVLTITHDMDFAAAVFERTIVFAQGRVLLDGTTREVFAERELLKHAHVEPPHVTQLGQKLGCRETFLTAEEWIRYKRRKS
nr:ABC transporter ATP-binding protein [Lihuaxuella thermophila]